MMLAHSIWHRVCPRPGETLPGRQHVFWVACVQNRLNSSGGGLEKVS